jgi:Zn-dependent peptidase ImmA (M78 family)
MSSVSLNPRISTSTRLRTIAGATIVYERLTGCEANIAGYGNKAIITVNSEGQPGRKRFSAGHELGHWMRDRGQSSFGCSGKQIDSEWTDNNPETRANRFSSDLLLPKRLFVPLAKNRPINLPTLHDLAATFQMSLTATALKLVDFGSYPAMLMFHQGGKRKSFSRPCSRPHFLDSKRAFS